MKNINLNSTVPLYFNTVDATGAAVAPSAALAASDFSIYKDGSAIQKLTTNGITVTSPFDAKVGCHKIDIDTSNSTGDIGFWAAGSSYEIILNTAKTSGSVSLDGLRVESFGIEYGFMVGTDGANIVVPDNTSVGSIKTKTDGLNFTGGDVQAVASNTAAEVAASEAAILARGSIGPWTTGGAGSVTLTPITSTVGAGEVSDEPVTYYIDEGKDLTITVVDGSGSAIDMTAKTMVMIVENRDKSDYFTVADGSIIKGGVGGNVLTITVPASVVTRVGVYPYAVRDVADPKRVWSRGDLSIEYAPGVG